MDESNDPIACDLLKNNGGVGCLSISLKSDDPCLLKKRKRMKKREDPDQRKKGTEEKPEIVVVSPYFLPKCPKEEDSEVLVKSKRGKTSKDTHFSDSYADPCLFVKKRENLMKEKSDVVVSPDFAPKCLKEEDPATGFPVCLKTKREKKRKDVDNTHISESCTDGPGPVLFAKKERRKRNGENPMKKESEIVVSPYFATKESGYGFPICVKAKEKMMKRKVETTAKEYTSVGLRKRVELEPGFPDSINVKHCASAVDKAMHEAWLDDFFSQFAYTGGTKSHVLQNINKCNLGGEINRGKGVWHKGRVVSPYFLKEAKESVSVRKVSPYFSSSKQADVHLGKVQTEGRKPKIKKSSPALTKAEKRDEAYRRITQDITWKPPLLGVKLLQHDHASDPWT